MTPRIRTLIVEDEHFAARALQGMLAEACPQINVLQVCDSVRSSVEWLSKNAAPDLIFMDIQLGDGLSFDIFERVNVASPVIFTTAYDQYALKAFENNGIHYLLKPVEKEALLRAVQRLPSPLVPDLSLLLDHFRPKPEYRTRFAVQSGESMAYVPVSDIAWFEGDDRYVLLVTRAGKRYIVDYLLKDLTQLLDPHRFFRLNRTYIAQIDAIQSVTLLSKSRLQVRLKPDTGKDLIVSAGNAQAFKRWLDEQP